MLIEFTRVLIGLAIALFHASNWRTFSASRIARWAPRSASAASRFPALCPNKPPIIYFSSSVLLIALFSLARIWMTLR